MAKCLNMHAAYRCRHSGACCRAGWPIPFDGNEFVSAGSLPLVPGGFIRDNRGGAHAARHPDGSCVFFDRGTSLCEIHRLGTQAALPLTCRMFPRRVLHDARGTFVSLSHFCPTAAALVFNWCEPLRVVDAPETLTGVGELDGLDARGEWPPLLRPGVLTDLESYNIWETRTIDLLTQDRRPP
ncbi:MAG: YkgJ family cysteine cluster protein, partial [Vicinamibacterales bacterium]